MPQLKEVLILREGLAEHPATRAWETVRASRQVPERILVLKSERKTAVYRLEGGGVGGSPVIAKRCRRSTAVVERTVYEEILPRLPIVTAGYYGFLEDDDPGYAWLFVEDLGPDSFSPEDPGHRRLAGQWIGTMHASAADLERAARLPDRGPSHYLAHLRRARRHLLEGHDNPVLGEDDRRSLRRLVSRLDDVEAGWDRVIRACRDIPRTLAHGDLDRRNMRVRGNGAGKSLLTFDWETAGWGVPAVDLLCTDLDAYCDAVRDRWPGTDRPTARHWVAVGNLLRESIASLSWRSEFLTFRWAAREVPCVVDYGTRMLVAFEALGPGPV
jgi:hypothetical protein